MPLDDLFDELEDFFEEIGDFFEDSMSILTGKKARKKLSKSVKKFGGPIAVAALGAAAYREWGEKKEKPGGKKKKRKKAKSGSNEKPEPPPLETIHGIEETAEIVTVTECLQMNMLLAMISAAGADGKIDRRELKRLHEAIDQTTVSAKDRALLTRMLNAPPPLEEVASGATSPLEACELYGAALSVLENDSPAETLFLRRFSAALKLDEDLVRTIHETLDSEIPP